MQDACNHPRHRERTTRLFFFNDTAPTEIYTLSLHDALPIFDKLDLVRLLLLLEAAPRLLARDLLTVPLPRSEEHTSELQSRENLVCRLLLEKKKKRKQLSIL